MGSECLVGSWCESHDEFEWGFLRRVAGPCVMSVLCDWEPVTPVCLRPIGIDSQELFHPLVCSFGLSIRLWVVRATDVLLDL